MLDLASPVVDATATKDHAQILNTLEHGRIARVQERIVRQFSHARCVSTLDCHNSRNRRRVVNSGVLPLHNRFRLRYLVLTCSDIHNKSQALWESDVSVVVRAGND
jgi:hypothetical protein